MAAILQSGLSKGYQPSLPTNHEILKDFDKLAGYLFDLVINELGFEHALFFMLEKDKKHLVLARASLSEKESAVFNDFQISIGDDNAVARSFNQKEIAQGQALAEFLPLFLDDAKKRNLVCLPMEVFGEVIGVMLLVSGTDDELTKIEQNFLMSLSHQIGLHVFTAWSLKNSLSQTKSLQATKVEYEELINIKKNFLKELQELFVDLMQKSTMNHETQVRLAESLMYLNSVMLLADSTINKHSSTPLGLEDA